MHECREKIRFELLQTILGQSAYLFYETWHRMCNRVPPHSSTFLVSTYFKSFVNFAEMVRKTKLPNPRNYIRLMIEKNIQPSLWTKDEMYVLYIETMDSAKDPIEHINVTIKTLINLCDRADIDIKEFFELVTPNEVAHLIRQRQLSPWVLLHSGIFKKFLLKCTCDEQCLLETIIRPAFWKLKFDKNPDGVEKVRKYVKELGI